MNNPTIQQPLSDDELNRLGGFLDEIGAPAMNMESLDGYFAALICGPDMVLPSEYLPGIWGEDFCFDSDRQSMDILGLLMRHWVVRVVSDSERASRLYARAARR
jgi:uncharacterized protein